jgi:hypothetical protein
MESALESWYSTRQEEAMIEQFSEAEPKSGDQGDWQRIRRAAAARKFKRAAR